MKHKKAKHLMEELTLFLPQVGDTWWWRPDLPHASQICIITGVVWDGKEWWIGSIPTIDGPGGKESWNDLSHWFHCAVLIKVNEPRKG